MPTVPNWIAKAVVITGGRSCASYPVKSWRATKTQVVVTLDNPQRTEVRFRLDGLVGVGADRGAELVDGESPAARQRLAAIKYKSAVADLETAMAVTRLDRIRSDPEALVTEIGKIQRAATKALAALADVL